MARGFRRKGSRENTRYVAQLDPLERATVAGLMDQVRELLDPPAPVPEGGDDFASIVAGLGMGVTVAAEDQADLDPDAAGRDPALDRLLPTANRQDDEVAAEFRRLTETGLRQRKAAARSRRPPTCCAARTGCAWTPGQARAVLTALTDVRLVLGERMGLRTDDDVDLLEAAAADLDPDDPLALRARHLRVPHLAAGDAGVRDAGRVSVGDAGSGAGGPAGRGRRVATVLAAVLAVALVALLLWPDGPAVNRGVVRLYVFFLDLGMPASVTPEAYAVLLNVLGFALLGAIGVTMLRWPPVRVALLLTAFSAAVELVQTLPSIGRDPSLLDVACNALGAVIGVVAASVVRRRRHGGGGAAHDQAGIHETGDERRDVGGDHLGG